MSGFCETEEEWFELLTRILCDVGPLGTADLIYLFAQTEDNEDSVIEKGFSLWNKGIGHTIGICAMEKKLGYSGMEKWFFRIRSKSACKPKVIGVKLDQSLPPCTDAEALGLIKLTKHKDWRTILIVAPPLHQVRVFVSTVSAAVREAVNVRIYSCVGESENWLQKVVHSQGVTTGKRKDLLKGELDKILKYHQKGDLVSAKEILSYLNQRDS